MEGYISCPILHDDAEVLKLVQTYLRKLLMVNKDLVKEMNNYGFRLQLEPISTGKFWGDSVITIKFVISYGWNDKNDLLTSSVFSSLKNAILNFNDNVITAERVENEKIHFMNYQYVELLNVSPLNNKRVILYCTSPTY